MSRALPGLLTLATGAAAFNFCGLVMNDTTGIFTFSTIDNNTGAIGNIVSLPMLDEFGLVNTPGAINLHLGISAGADYGTYYTVSGNYTEQEEYLIVDAIGANPGKYRQINLAGSGFEFLSLYGVGALNTDPVTHQVAAMILGYASDQRRYAFLASLNDTTGNIDKVIYNLTDAYRTWVYLYTGVSAWDPESGMYYLAAVTGIHDYTTLYGFNVTSGNNSANPEVIVPYTDGLGDYMSISVSPALKTKYPGTPGLLALVDDDNNSAAALWYLNSDLSSWIHLYQYPMDTLSFAGNNDMELSADGYTAYSVFYDNNTPIANQVVTAVDLSLATPKEVGRTIVQGSQAGTAIADLAKCPQ